MPEKFSRTIARESLKSVMNLTGGLVMSPEGGFEEVAEFLLAFVH